AIACAVLAAPNAHGKPSAKGPTDAPVAAPPNPNPAGSAKSAADDASQRPLSPLPKPRSLDLPLPTVAAKQALDALLARLVSRDAGERETAIREIAEVEPDALPAIHQRLGELANSSDHSAMKDMLASVRDKSREESGKKSQTPDYLEMLEAHARTD